MIAGNGGEKDVIGDLKTLKKHLIKIMRPLINLEKGIMMIVLNGKGSKNGEITPNRHWIKIMIVQRGKDLEKIEMKIVNLMMRKVK